MTHFEYLSVAVSIIFALSIGRLVAALPNVVSSGRRDWLHVGHFACLLVVQMQFWWRMWQFKSVTEWDFLGFFLLFAVTLLYYLATHILVPANYAEVDDWQDHFAMNQQWFHGIVALAWASSGAVSGYLMKVFFIPPPMPITVLLFATAIAYSRRWFHFVVLVWWASLLTVITLGLQQGAA